MPVLTQVVGWSIVLIVDLMALVVLLRMFRGDIDLSLLLSEQGGEASLSRFQLFVFTYVISLTLFWVTLTNSRFPEITGGLLSLLGISASTYAVSKGIQSTIETAPALTLAASAASVRSGQQVTVTASVAPQAGALSWSLSPDIGSLSVSGHVATYTAPAAVANPTVVTVTAAPTQSPASGASITINALP
jgi:hypothetical protein